MPPTTGPSTTGPSTTVRPADQAELALPGDWFDIGPEEGTPMDAIGVRYDDVLNLRSLPQAEAPIVATAVPLAATPDIRSAGEGRLFTGRVSWWKVTVDGQEAWANLRHLGALGPTDDILGALSADLPSLQWNSVDDLVAAIVAARSPVGDGSQPLQVEDVAPPTDTTRVFDLIGFADDSLRGERISITVDSSGGEVTLVGAERTLICHRGATDGGCL